MLVGRHRRIIVRARARAERESGRDQLLDCAGFVAKPFSIGQLREAVTAALARKAAATAPS